MCQEESLSSFGSLVHIVARLRGPGGCPWDREQTHSSLKHHLIEECYEVLETLDQGDDEKLCEELGDVLMQVVLHAQIAQEEGKFNMGDVIESISSKLIRRHPHVFSDVQASDAEEVAHRWDRLKQAEREGGSILDGLPKGMPALACSHAMQQRAARVGFDWENEEEIVEKLVEEVKEIQQATDQQSKTEEFGDILFTMVNVGRRQGINSEEALRYANHKFRSRFAYMEQICQERGVALASLPLKEQDVLWEEAKRMLSLDSET